LSYLHLLKVVISGFQPVKISKLNLGTPYWICLKIIFGNLKEPEKRSYIFLKIPSRLCGLLLRKFRFPDKDVFPRYCYIHLLVQL